MDLAYAMQEDLDAVVLLDAAPRGLAPGTLTVIEPEIDARRRRIDAHGMDPVKVLALARSLGRLPRDAGGRLRARDPDDRRGGRDRRRAERAGARRPRRRRAARGGAAGGPDRETRDEEDPS